MIAVTITPPGSRPGRSNFATTPITRPINAWPIMWIIGYLHGAYPAPSNGPEQARPVTLTSFLRSRFCLPMADGPGRDAARERSARLLDHVHSTVVLRVDC